MTVFLLVLGGVFAAYGVMIMAVNSGTPFFAVWFMFAACSFAGAIASKTGAWGRVPLALRRVIQAVAIAFSAWVIGLSCVIMTQANQVAPAGLDTIVVLGAQVMPDGSPATVLRYRLEAALDYLNENPDTVCVVTGAKGSNEPISEAECMANYLEKHGISPSRIIIEDESDSTLENLRNSRALIPDGENVGIVTNNFHLWRSLNIARSEGYSDPAGISARSDLPYLPNNLLRECLSSAWGAVRGLVTGG